MKVELIVDGQKFDLSTNSNACCFAKAIQRGQSTFTVVEQDITAAATVMFWLSLNQATLRAEKERLTLAIIEQMSKSTLRKKWAD